MRLPDVCRSSASGADPALRSARPLNRRTCGPRGTHLDECCLVGRASPRFTEGGYRNEVAANGPAYWPFCLQFRLRLPSRRLRGPYRLGLRWLSRGATRTAPSSMSIIPMRITSMMVKYMRARSVAQQNAGRKERLTRRERARLTFRRPRALESAWRQYCGILQRISLSGCCRSEAFAAPRQSVLCLPRSWGRSIVRRGIGSAVFPASPS